MFVCRVDAGEDTRRILAADLSFSTGNRRAAETLPSETAEMSGRIVTGSGAASHYGKEPLVHSSVATGLVPDIIAGTPARSPSCPLQYVTVTTRVSVFWITCAIAICHSFCKERPVATGLSVQIETCIPALPPFAVIHDIHAAGLGGSIVIGVSARVRRVCSWGGRRVI